MITDVLRSVYGLEIFPVAGLCLFLAAFGLVIWWTLTLDKQVVDDISQLPLDRRHDSEGASDHD